ncbi:biopolymer transporter ExbD [Vibrio sp. S11_S32]|uniref:ExbD/TolR family protein n=1 Tax=Vibrio sp. S11_S32 TaxID=2720225 RepID=UPI0016800A82|nr:biopolymer transporter ExbD [Vibrio sp. S11_S32]MBD1576625.1 biopolymer transporter ExbD [Vibrio sp. S11_S32]
MIRSQPTKNTQALAPDLTPLLDIIFIVMVFLLLTASVKLSSLEVQLPDSEASATQAVDSQSITLNILTTEPFWAIDGQAMADWPQFQASLIEHVKQAPERPIVIAADKSAEIQHIVKLFAFLHQHNIAATQILMEDPKL